MLDKIHQEAKVARQTGVVKWYNEEKGYGFIEKDEDGKDLFVHYRALKGKLNQGDRVEFDVGQASKGPCAIKIKVVQPAPDEESSD